MAASELVARWRLLFGLGAVALDVVGKVAGENNVVE